MNVPIGFVGKLWSCICFLPFFLLISILAFTKAAIFGPIAAIIIFTGCSAVIIGLWSAHFLWTYCCMIKTKRLGLTLKILLLVSLPLPLILWPVIGIPGSLLVGLGYGIFTPLKATFEASGEKVMDKFKNYFLDGCWSTLEGSCTIVQDFTDFCFHSYFSYMDELSENVHEGENPMDIKLSMLPSCFLISLIAVPVDVVLITAIALSKSPSMLIKGWKRLLEDLIGREGPFLEAVCVPFAGLAIILWPLAVIGAVLSAFLCSFFLGFYGGVIVHQEDSMKMGLAYIVSVVSLFDEYTNDLLYLREGSCLPRPKYRKNMVSQSKALERKKSIDVDGNDQKNDRSSVNGSKLESERSRTFKWSIQHLKPVQVRNISKELAITMVLQPRTSATLTISDISYCKTQFTASVSAIRCVVLIVATIPKSFLILEQVWDWLFRSCEVNSRLLLRDGVIDIKDIEECIVKGECKKLGIKLPAWCILQCLLSSAKTGRPGLLIADGVEMTNLNWPKDKVFDWFIGPLLVMKEQIKGLHLDENEEACLRNLIMSCNNERPEDWNSTGFPSDDGVRRAQLQAIIRRLQGIVASMTRMPTFRRRFHHLVKVLYIEAIERTDAALSSRDGGRNSKTKAKFKGPAKARRNRKENFKSNANCGETGCADATSTVEGETYDNGNIV
ncbi:hypothetical protein GIB67_037817 [Kingdonia uniflora]|uniref:Steroid nuclear receptor ligand-binding n=1 Tax=Kingdonia uniflora TaxID=39325 RepID=A0A7J7NA02_9MAGN|nr:hypothetical protein GIB67_037817 [Kingdonia uniflora]